MADIYRCIWRPVGGGLRFVQGSCRAVTAGFIEVELTGCCTLKGGRVFGFIESCRFAVKR
jgi:hypothetical protein